MFDLKLFVEPIITDVEAAQLVSLTVFSLELINVSNLPWEDVFLKCKAGFKIPSPITKGEFENIAVFDLRDINKDVIIFARLNHDWTEYLTHFQYNIQSKTWTRLSTTYDENHPDFHYLKKIVCLTVNYWRN